MFRLVLFGGKAVGTSALLLTQSVRRVKLRRHPFSWQPSQPAAQPSQMDTLDDMLGGVR